MGYLEVRESGMELHLRERGSGGKSRGLFEAR